MSAVVAAFPLPVAQEGTGREPVTGAPVCPQFDTPHHAAFAANAQAHMQEIACAPLTPLAGESTLGVYGYAQD
jgi:hypothetical protein